jgi:putative metallohydrolase (TIGR04338 family)
VASPRLAPHQAALYAAEAETIDVSGRRWLSLGDAQVYLDGLIDSAWFFANWPTLVRATIERRGHGASWSTCHALDAGGPGGTATEGALLVAERTVAQSTLLHELAHLLVPPGSGHGPEFVQTLLTLVRHEMGFFAYAELRRALAQDPRPAAASSGVPVGG